MESKKILIVGAGIAGLAMYHALKQQGLNATIIEKQSDWYCSGSGIGLPANSVEGLSQLGLLEPLLARSHRIEQIEYALANGDTLSIASLTQPPLNQQPFLALLRRDLIEILSEGVTAVRFDTTAHDIVQDASGVEVSLSSGDTERYDLLIAADGIRSSIRAAVFPHAYIRQLGMTNWRFIIQQDTTGMHPIYYLGKDDVFMTYPIAPDQVYCYGHILDVESHYLARSPIEALKERFGHYTAAVSSAIDAIGNDNEVVLGRIESVITDEVASGRVVLIGDALHGCPPTLQQGAGQAVEDALALSRLLATESIDSALVKYKAQRMPQIRWVVNESNRIMRLGLLGKYFLGRIARNMKVRRSGPVNVIGWRTLMSRRFG